jgi:Xaa-Pro aminopeptidase
MVLLNRDRAVALMRECNVDAIVATSPPNVLYLSDYACWLDPLFKAYMMRPGAPAELAHNFAVLPAAGEPALVVPGIWAGNAADSWVQDLWLHSIGDLDLSAVPSGLDASTADLYRRVEAGRQRAHAIDALRDMLRERGLASGRIGLELEGLSPTERERLADALPGADIRDCSNLLRVIRMVKSAEEISRLERSTQINHKAAMDSLGAARVGTTMGELRQHYVSQITQAGAQLDHFIASPRGIGIRQEPDYRLEDGDILYVDYGCIYQHYYSDNGTTLVIGEFPPELSERYDVLRDGLQAGIELLRPGVPASKVREAMIATLALGNITGSNAHGHGVGLEVRDYPIIMPETGLRIRDDCVDISSDVPLEAGMVVNLELPLYLFGLASLHMEQTFLITPGGCKRLDSDDATRPVQVEFAAAGV